MIDHIGLAVSNMERSKAFYLSALKPVGIGVIMEVSAEESGGDAHAGFGKDNKAFFWIGTGGKPRGGAHVAFTAQTRAEVDTFYRAALDAGGLQREFAAAAECCGMFDLGRQTLVSSAKRWPAGGCASRRSKICCW